MANVPSEPTQAMQKIARACCDPLWIQHRVLATGHDETIDNGTASFIKFGGGHYVCTCAHVIEAAENADFVPALMLDNNILNLASPHHRHNFRFPDRKELDIAIAPLTPFHWGLLESNKCKSAIDLDSWEEPDWPKDGYFAAAGYFNEHKYKLQDKLATPMGFIWAELASDIGPQFPRFVLQSRMDVPHGYFFSGMSGGPIFLPVEEDKMLPVGIIFQGGPSSGRVENPHSLITSQDIFVRGYTLTPQTFSRWLSLTDLRR
jgi:hypothetical protein